MTALEIIDETVAFYSEDVTRRAVNGNCYYLTDDGRCCAVGRCLTKKGLTAAHRFDGLAVPCGSASLSGHLGGLPLFVRYQGQSLVFWNALQGLHDIKRFWGENGLTVEGRERAATLRRRYA